MQVMSILFLGHGNTFEHQHERAACGADVDGLIRSIEHEHGRVHGQTSMFVGDDNAGRSHSRRGMMRSGMTVRKVVSRHGRVLYPATARAKGLLFPPFDASLRAISAAERYTLATVATTICFAPAARGTRAHSLSVVPWVYTSSTR